MPEDLGPSVTEPVHPAQLVPPDQLGPPADVEAEPAAPVILPQNMMPSLLGPPAGGAGPPAPPQNLMRHRPDMPKKPSGM